MNPFRITHRQRGLTLVELMVVILVVIPALLITILVFVRCLDLIELSRNTSRAMIALKNQCNQIELADFNQISATYDQVSFQSAGLTGRGISYVESLQADLLRVTLTFSWREKSGRVVGDDKDLDGVLDAGEDADGNGMLDSPAKLVTLIHQL